MVLANMDSSEFQRGRNPGEGKEDLVFRKKIKKERLEW